MLIPPVFAVLVAIGVQAPRQTKSVKPSSGPVYFKFNLGLGLRI